MTRIRYKQYPCGNHRSNHVFINDGDIGSDYYRVRIIPPKDVVIFFTIQITNSKEEVILEAYDDTLSMAKNNARQRLVDMGAKLSDEVRRRK